MKKQLLPVVILLTLSFTFNHQAAANDCWINPCDEVAPCDDLCPDPCGDVCGTNGSYLYDKSIFDAPMFNNRLIGKKSKSRISLYGWLLTGITVNSHGTTNEYGGNGSAYDFNNRRYDNGAMARPGMNDQSGNTYMLQLEQPSDWKVNQLWFGAKRDLDNRFGWGFQADFVYGTDSRYARNWGDRSFDHNWGSGDYFGSFSQLYGTIGTKDLFLKVGKFAGGFSYEGLAATREYFYTHANICYGRPLTTQGAMIEWHPNKKWMITGGWTAGVFNSFDNPDGDSGFLGKVTYNFNKDMALTYKIYYNDRGARTNPYLPQNRGQIDCFNTFIFTWKINNKWFYMGEIANTDSTVYSTAGPKLGSDAWGVNNHLIRTFNDKLSAGIRWEYHRSHGSSFDVPSITTPGGGVPGGQGADMWNVTLAAHYKLTPKVTFRPEVRYDYVDYENGYRPFAKGKENDQICGGASFLVVF